MSETSMALAYLSCTLTGRPTSSGWSSEAIMALSQAKFCGVLEITTSRRESG